MSTEEKHMNTKTLKSGSNKGNRRIWIEGDFLIQNGIQNGMRFSKAIILGREEDGDCLTLTICAGGPRTHKVAGTVSRPIIDLCGAWVTAFMADRAFFTVTIYAQDGIRKIAIHPCS
jgi:hypothetical protein